MSTKLPDFDNKVLQEINSTHSPDANVVVEGKALLTIVKDILHKASPSAHGPCKCLVDLKTDNEVMINKAHHQQVIRDALAFTIHKIGCEISCSGKGDMKVTTLAVFNSLAKYSWDAKVVLALAAFALSYGEFYLVSKQHATSPIAKSMVLLKPLLLDISDRESIISSLLELVMEVIDCIIELMDLPLQYFSHDKPPLFNALNFFPIAVYWAIKCIVACASESVGLIKIDNGDLTSIAEARKKLSDLARTLISIHTDLQKQLVLCRKNVVNWKEEEDYCSLKHFFKIPHKDVTEVLLKVIYTKDAQPLFNGVNKQMVGLDVLRGKTVILFISYLDISDEEIKEIVQMGGKTERQYEVVWLPIIGRWPVESSKQEEIHRKASLMSWYSLHYSSSLQPAFIRYIEKVWHFEKKPLLVALNPQGIVVRANVYHMIMIWGIKAFPFDIHWEETLWKETRWCLDFLIGEIDSNKEQWLKEGTVICFYGGEDLDWIKKFTSTMKEATIVSRINLEMIYVGKKYRETIMNENISKCWDLSNTSRFKHRLESICYSKMVLGQSIADDTVMKDLKTLLCYDGNEQEWTMIGQGSKNMVTMNGEKIIKRLLNIKNSGVKFTSESFIVTLKDTDEINKILLPDHAHKHCCHHTVSTTSGVIQEKVVCNCCNRPMEKYISYKCCSE